MPFPPERTVRGVLFDLDGTLLDTAPDMASALNALRVAEGLAPLPFEKIRGEVSHGSKAMIETGFGKNLAEDQAEALRQRFLGHYTETLCRDTKLFPRMESVLDTLEKAGMAWGVVTNKPAFLTHPLLRALHLEQRCCCIVSGDTLPRRKPYPDPLIHAAAQCGLAPAQCVYIGDAERDIASGRAAGMATAVACWGYIGADDHPEIWGADHLLHKPADVLVWLRSI